MSYTVIAYNIYKVGQSSPYPKEAAVSTVIDLGFAEGDVADCVMLCEVHSARGEDISDFLVACYEKLQQKSVHFVHGGKSNNYLISAKRGRFENCPQKKDVRRMGIWVAQDNPLAGVGFLHAKSGQIDGRTDAQIAFYCQYLESAFNGRWCLCGDMNWDTKQKGEIHGLPDGAWYFYPWGESDTHTSIGGGTSRLDYFIAGSKCRLACNRRFNQDVSRIPEIMNMAFVDHLPIAANVTFAD